MHLPLAEVVVRAGKMLKNKEIAIERFLTLIEKALTPKVARKKTKPSKASKEQRLNEKRKLSEKKSSRRYKLD